MHKQMMAILFAFFATTAGAQALTGFQQISPGVARGPRPSLEAVPLIAQYGFKTVLNLQGGDLKNFGMVTVVRWWEPGEIPENIAAEKTAAEAAGLAFFNYPLNALAPVTDDEDLVIDKVLAAMSDPLQQPVFVHCERGIDRTGMIIALYRVMAEGWAVKDAYNEWIASGHTMTARFFTGDLDVYYFKKARAFIASHP